MTDICGFFLTGVLFYDAFAQHIRFFRNSSHHMRKDQLEIPQLGLLPGFFHYYQYFLGPKCDSIKPLDPRTNAWVEDLVHPVWDLRRRDGEWVALCQGRGGKPRVE
jgi:hypothetical protein